MANRIFRLALLSASLLGAAPAMAQNVGVTSAVVNDVRITTQTNRTLHPATVRERVSLGNDIVTGRVSRAQILLLDRTTFTVGANARLKIDRFVYDPARNSSTVGASVSGGAFRFMSGRATHGNRGASNIRTPAASIGIRGTIVDGVVGADAIAIAQTQPGLPSFDADPGTATLILLRGPSAFSGEEAGGIDVTGGGATVPIDTPGYAVFIPRNGAAPIGPFALTPEGFAMFDRLLGNPDGGTAPARMPNYRAFNDSPFAPARQLPVPRDGNPVIGVDPVVPPGQGPGGPVVVPGGPQMPAVLPPRI